MNSAQYLDDSQYEVRVAGRFKMGKKVGSGSFGEIFLAVDLNTNKEVAIKFVSHVFLLLYYRSRRKLEGLNLSRKPNFSRIL